MRELTLILILSTSFTPFLDKPIPCAIKHRPKPCPISTPSPTPTPVQTLTPSPEETSDLRWIL